MANKFRGKKISKTNGRPLDLRLHLGAMVAQSMNNWTARQTEEMLRYHAGVRVLCGLEETTDSIDRTSIEKFETWSELCSSDSTVQEPPIQHPTDFGHLKRIGEIAWAQIMAAECPRKN